MGADAQVRLNHSVYMEKHRTRLEEEEFGRVVLMHDGEIIDIYDESIDAYTAGVEKYGLGSFSIKRIGQGPVRLPIATELLEPEA